MAATAHAPARAPQVRPAARPGARPDGPKHTPRAHLQLVEAPAGRRRLRTGPTFALGAVLAFAIAFAVVACQVVLVQGQQRLDQVNTDITLQTDRYNELRLQVAQLESPGRIVEAATTLGMVPPPEVTYLTPTGVITVPTATDDTSGTTEVGAPDHLAEHAATRPNLEGGR